MKVHFTNFGYSAQQMFNSLADALRYGKARGFEFSVLGCDTTGNYAYTLASWSPVNGTRFYD